MSAPPAASASTSASASAARRRTVTRAEVVEAARDILDGEGHDGLTMASVARRVGFTTMAVYRHVKNRDDLVASAVELVLGEIGGGRGGTGGDEVDWLDGVETWMNEVRACLLAHPWAADGLGTRQGGSSVPWTNTLQLLAHHVARSPLDARDQARALAWTTRLTVGMLIIEIAAPITRTTPPPTPPPPAPPATSDPLATALSALGDDGLWSDALHQTRRFLTSLAP